MEKQMDFGLQGSVAEGPPLTTLTVLAVPENLTAVSLAQAIVDFVECETAYKQQAFSRVRLKMHADGAEAKLPKARKRLSEIAKAVAKANGAEP